MKKWSFAFALLLIAGAVFGEETGRKNYITNGDFADGKNGWILHYCRFEDGQVVFNHQEVLYTQLWQVVKATPPAGSKVAMEIVAKVTDPEGLLKEKSAFTRIMVIFRNAEKKEISLPSEKGLALRLDDTNGEYKTFTRVYTVPEGVVEIWPLTIVKDPVRVEVKSVRLWQLD